MSQIGEQVIPEGYKQTEIGIIPNDWDNMPLRSALKESPKYGINAAAVPLQGNLPVYIRITDISEDGYFKSSERVGVNSPFSNLYKLKTGDIVLARTGASVGKSYLYRESDGELVYAGFLIKVSPNTEMLNPEFLFQYLKTEQYWAWVIVNSMRSGQPGVNGNEFASFLIPLPYIEEQTAIANALSDVDALLTELENLIAKKQAIKTATMQQLLTGKTRLPQFATHTEGEKKGQTKGTKPSELGEIPEDWDAKAFGQVMCIRHGKDQKAVQVNDGQYPIFGTGGQMGTTNTPLYDKPSVLIGRKGTINKPRYADQPFWTVDTLFYSEILKYTNAKFIFYKFCMIDWMQYNEASGVPSLNASTIENVTASFPKLEEQTAIAAILSDIDNDIQTLEQRLKKTRQIKQGMMQELLTGRTRLQISMEAE
jgi:type I restriction enzyme S subunit